MFNNECPYQAEVGAAGAMHDYTCPRNKLLRTGLSTGVFPIPY